ncbi:MAG: hypothetical protein ACKVZH_25955 [Blastocatellia bacterium]
MREKAEARLIGGLESDDPELRRLAAEVRLSRRLKSLQRIDEQREIDPSFVTCAEYQLFLDDLRAQGKYHQPDHWDALTFPAGQALSSMSGVRAKDAAAFCEWLTQRQAGEWRFRLPLADEASQWQTKENRMAAWCQDAQSFRLIGLSSAQEQTITQQLLAIESLIFSQPVIAPHSLARTLDLAHTFDLARTLDLTSVLACALDLTRDHALDRDLARALDVARVIDRTLALDRDLDVARARARARARYLALAFARHRELTTARNLERARDLDLALALAFTLVLARASDFSALADLVERGKLTEARYMAANVQNDSNKYVSRTAALLEALLSIVLAESKQTMHLAQRRYLARLLDYAYIGYSEMSSYERSLRPRAKSGDEAGSRVLLEAHWWLQIVNARAEGKLPAWEGIRIVRERVQA